MIAGKTREKKTRRKKKVVKKSVSADLLKDKRVLYAAIAIVVIVIAGWRLTTFMIPINTDITTQQGSGLEIVAGDTVKVEYTGTLEGGEEFDSGELEFEMGAGQMIAGFEEAILGMENGEEKTFTIPPEKAYGPTDPAKTQEFPLTRTVNKSIEITASEFSQTIGEDPVEGETYNTETTTWPIKVLSVSGENVVIEYLPEDGSTLDYDYGYETIHIIGDELEITLTPTVGSEIMTLGGPLKIIDADEYSMTLDFNHPLAGKPLTFTVRVTGVTKPIAAAGVAGAGNDACSQLGIPKADRPAFELNIFSFCPGGTGGQAVTIPVGKAFQDKADFRVRFFSEMHGEHERVENIRQICVQEVDPAKYWDYAEQFILNIYNPGVCGTDVDCVNGKAGEIMANLGIDEAAVSECMDESGDDLYAFDKYVAASLQLSYSPSFVINGKYLGNIERTPEGVKTALCCAFNDPPAECDTAINSAVQASSASCG